MKKHIYFPLLLSLLLVSCGSSSSHPLVGNKFNLSSQSAVAAYDTGYDETSYFALIGGVNANYATLDSFDRVIRSSFTDGFLKISDTLVDDGYLSYVTTDEKSIFTYMVPSDDKGIEMEKGAPTNESHSKYIVTASNDEKSFNLIFSKFEKVTNGYDGVFISIYYPDSTDTSKATLAAFAYTFTLAQLNFESKKYLSPHLINGWFSFFKLL